MKIGYELNILGLFFQNALVDHIDVYTDTNYPMMGPSKCEILFMCNMGTFPSKPHAHVMYLSLKDKLTKIAIF